jgi:7,8-dihydroneopterin aldolase/epimerase/oxygenase
MLGFRMRTDDDHQIHVEQLEIVSRIGVPKTERAKPQRLTVNVTLWPARDFRDLNDDIRQAVDYSALCEEIKKIAREQSPKLIETLADLIAGHLVGTFAVRKITVEVRKFVLADAAYASVTVTRRARVG